MFPSFWFTWLLVVVQCCFLVESKQVEIIRASNGDRFSTFCCNCCNKYNAFCAPPDFCQCNNGLSYYNDTDGYSCFTKSEILHKCSYGIRSDGQNNENIFFKLTNSNIELGNLFVKKDLNMNMNKCHLNSIHFDAIQKWKLSDISDFQLIYSKGKLKLKFVGYPKDYSGKLLKLTVTCDSKTSCLMFKIEGKMKTITEDATNFNEIVKTTASPHIEDKEKVMSKWKLWVIIGVILVVSLVVIFFIVFIVKRKRKQKRNHQNSKKSIKKSKKVLTTQIDSNRNSIHDQVAMYVAHDEHAELSNAYVDPDDVFNKGSSKINKNPNYDYAYSHSAMPPPAEKHEYMDIEAPEHSYAKPAPLPCPDSRKSMGYAILKGVDDVKEPSSPSVPSEYQSLTLEENDNLLAQDEDPGSPTYFQLDNDHAI